MMPNQMRMQSQLPLLQVRALFCILFSIMRLFNADLIEPQTKGRMRSGAS